MLRRVTGDFVMLNRFAVLSLLFIGVGCGRDKITLGQGGDLSFEPATLQLTAAVGSDPVERTLQLRNNARYPLEVGLSIAAPFAVEPEALRLMAGQAVDLRVLFKPVSAGSVSSALIARSEEQLVSAWVTGHAFEARTCSASSPCVRARFDSSTLSCTEEPLPDATPCESPCLLNGQCRAGVCVGEARHCDDANACTLDACDPKVGCVAVAAQCAAPADPCRVAFCDSVSGCGSTPVDDGTPCGPSDCLTANVCIAGSCQLKARPVFGNCGVEAIGAGARHTCAAPAGGGVRCWGDNSSGQLGNGTLTNSPTPVSVVNFSDQVTALALATNYSCALTVGGGVKCWGDNSLGQLGDGSMVSRSFPADVKGLTSGVASISVSDSHACAVTVNGGLKCWGFPLLWSPLPGSSVPVDAGGVVDIAGYTSGVAAVALGNGYTCVVVGNDRRVNCWGSTPSDFNAAVSTVVGVDAITIKPGYWKSCEQCFGYLSDDTINFTLGSGGIKALRLNAWSLSWGLLVDVHGLPPSHNRIIAAVDEPYEHCALTQSGELYCWSRDNFWWAYKVNVPAAAGMARGREHGCVLLKGGGVKCWGDNSFGQLGVGLGTTHSSVPLDVAL